MNDVPVNPMTGIGITEKQADEMRRQQPWLVPGLQADYVPATFDGINSSGLIPRTMTVLVKMDACSNTSKGGIIMVDQRVERMNEAAVTGVIIAVGRLAFHNEENAPQPGDRVYIEKYAGIKAIGADGCMYRLVEERSVAAKITDDFKALIEGEI